MKTKLVFEGHDCALVVEPTDDEDKALLAAFGVKGDLEAYAEMKPSYQLGERKECLRVVIRPRMENRIVERAG